MLGIGATIGDTLFCASATELCQEIKLPAVVTASLNLVNERLVFVAVFVPGESSHKAIVASCAVGNGLTLIDTTASLVHPVAVSKMRATYIFPSGTFDCITAGLGINVPSGGAPPSYHAMVRFAAGIEVIEVS